MPLPGLRGGRRWGDGYGDVGVMTGMVVVGGEGYGGGCEEVLVVECERYVRGWGVRGMRLRRGNEVYGVV